MITLYGSIYELIKFYLKKKIVCSADIWLQMTVLVPKVHSPFSKQHLVLYSVSAAQSSICGSLCGGLYLLFSPILYSHISLDKL